MFGVLGRCSGGFFDAPHSKQRHQLGFNKRRTAGSCLQTARPRAFAVLKKIKNSAVRP